MNTLRLVALPTLMLLSIPSTEAAPLTISLGDSEPIKKQWHSFNCNLLMPTALHGISYSSDEFTKVARDLLPGGLRFPGGTTANNYLWREDTFSIQQNDQTGWAAQQLALFRKIGRRYDLDGYISLCREHSIEPIHVLNIYEESPESVITLIEHYRSKGLPLRAIELGNETYWDPRSLMNVWRYIEIARPLANAIRRHDPTIQIGACFGPARADSPFPEKWNAPLAKQQWFDAAIYHEYYGGQGFALEAGAELPLAAVPYPEAYIDEGFDHLAAILPDTPIWFTEWNIGAEGLNQWKNTGAELLFITAAITRILDHRERVEWSCFHQLFEKKFGTAYFDKEQGLRTLPSYQLFRLISQVWSGADKFIEIPTPADSDCRGFATRGPDGDRLLIFNRSSQPVELALPETLDGHQMFAIDASPEIDLAGSPSFARQPSAVPAGTMTLRAHTIIALLPAAE
ncbi:MAG: hypothetical protein AAF236_03960 [Verrucomicrobiota bacterium]